MRQYLILLLLSFTMIGCAYGQKPTKADITKVMKTTWEKPASSFTAKTTIDINDIKFGTSSKANYAQNLDGIPKGAMVTSAKIDFTQNTFNTDGVHKVRRITTAAVYKDQFGEWAVMNTGTVYPAN